MFALALYWSRTRQLFWYFYALGRRIGYLQCLQTNRDLQMSQVTHYTILRRKLWLYQFGLLVGKHRP